MRRQLIVELRLWMLIAVSFLLGMLGADLISFRHGPPSGHAPPLASSSAVSHDRQP